MNIGFCRLELFLPAARSLKDRRQVARSLTARIRDKFNVAVSEEGNDKRWQSLTLGVCVLSTDSAHANQILSRVVSFVEESRPDLELLDYGTEMIPEYDAPAIAEVRYFYWKYPVVPGGS